MEGLTSNPIDPQIQYEQMPRYKAKYYRAPSRPPRGRRKGGANVGGFKDQRDAGERIS